MPSDTMRAEFEALRRAAKEATDTAREIEERLRSIDGQAQDIRATWTGPAASAYLTQWDDISDDCVQMLADLHWIGDSLSVSAATYQAMEQRHTDMLAIDPREL
jgi:WXG100 family type VII secretion target